MSKLKRKKRVNCRRGFTLMELLIVVVIVAIAAAAAIPSMIGFIRHGQQINRDNIARTLYVAMQNQLSRTIVEGNLGSVLTQLNDGEDAIDIDPDSPDTDGEYVGHVATMLEGNYPADDEDNAENVYYISKPRNYELGSTALGDSGPIVDAFYHLLDEVIVNKEILDAAILMEFNIETGVVLSIFYSDGASLWFTPGTGRAGELTLEYNSSGDDNDVTGARGMSEDGYITTAYSRNQGYYGVTHTGFVQLPFMDMINIYDGASVSFNEDSDGFTFYEPAVEGSELGLDTGLDKKINTLFVEALLMQDIQESGPPNPFDMPSSREIYVFDETETPGFPYIKLNTSTVSADFMSAKTAALGTADFVYLDGEAIPVDHEAHGILIRGTYNRYIWVLDFIEGDLFEEQPHSIFRNEKYLDEPSLMEAPSNIRAAVKYVDEDPDIIAGTVTSLTVANTHFNAEWQSGTYDITSTRHLNNMRYLVGDVGEDMTFVQSADIDIATLGGGDYNFAPIGAPTLNSTLGVFQGTYNAVKDSSSQYRIHNLYINTYIAGNVGLFASVGGEGSLTGISLISATINAPNATNVGAIAGVLDGGTISRSNSFANITGGVGNTGGLVGEISDDGMLTNSFNAGFYNTLDGSTATPDTGDVNGDYGSVMADGDNIGGLVGSNSGTVQNCFNNARVNVIDVELLEGYLSISPTYSTDATSAANIGGIAGQNSGSIENNYATNYVGDSTYSGGIVGSGTGTVSFSYYISNGKTGDKAITKDELSDQTTIGGLAGGEFDASGKTYESKTENNTYNDYPYPIIRNNNPFNDFTEWGWEDIEGETETPGARLVYYEVYDGNVFGFQSDGPMIHHSYDIGNPLRQTAADERPIAIHDGYALELLEVGAGYNIVFGEESGDSVTYYVRNVGGNWHIYENVSDTLVPLDGWLAPQTFTAVPPSVEEETTVCRVYIPNEEASRLVSAYGIGEVDSRTSVSVTVYRANTANLDNLPVNLIIPTTTFHPFYALNTASTAAAIRSPRHIENIDKVPSGSFTQRLDIDFAEYSRELRLIGITYSPNPADAIYTTTHPVYTDALVRQPFTGGYNGAGGGGSLAGSLPVYIENVRINAPSSSNIGLFGTVESSGRVQNVTLRDPQIIGGTNVGAIAGSVNGGHITYCSVQHSANQAAGIASHPVTVTGSQNVGGIAGSNSGTITDVLFVSTSARPAVQHTSGGIPAGTYIGGIVGTTSGTVDRIVYLAVAPSTTGTAGITGVNPYSGSGSYGTDSFYLSGTRPLRPFQSTFVSGLIVNGYNHLTMQPPPGGFVTLDLINQSSTVTGGSRAANWDNWGIATLGDAMIASTENPDFPYPYPDGTVVPEYNTWPLVVSPILPDSVDMVYYEIYEDGANGIFTRFFTSSTSNDIEELNLLNPNGVVIEAGYAFRFPGHSGNRTIYASSTGGRNSWHGILTMQLVNLPTLTNVPELEQMFKIMPLGFMTDYYNATQPRIDPTSIIYILVPDTGNLEGRILAVAAVNPFFAKEIYPIRVNAAVVQQYPELTDPHTTHSIRTSWQMQNISRVTEYSGTAVVSTTGGTSAGHTFVQELDLSFDSSKITTSEITSGNATGNGAGTRAVVLNTGAAQTANIIRANFSGIYEGNGKSVSNLTLAGTGTTTGKGLFSTITGVVRNLSMYTCALTGGTGNNAGIASTNNGTIENITITGSSVSGSNNTAGIASANGGTIENITLIGGEISGTGADSGGVVSTNNGNIENISMIECTVSGTTGSGGIAAINNNDIKDVAFVSTDTTPVSGGITSGGIVATNGASGTIENVLYIARASWATTERTTIAPIVYTNNNTGPGAIENTYFLSGNSSFTIDPPDDRYPNVPVDFNNAPARSSIGTPATTQELYALRAASPWNDSPWIQPSADIAYTMTSMSYPYPRLRTAVPSQWPVATRTATSLAYYEIYEDLEGDEIEEWGFYTSDGIDTLKTGEELRGNGADGFRIAKTGYCALFDAHERFTVKIEIGRGAGTMHNTESEPVLVDGNPMYAVILDGVVTPTTDSIATPVRINDTHAGHINTLFAKAVYNDDLPITDDFDGDNLHTFSIRTPEQMRNISGVTAETGWRQYLEFVQECDLDFDDDDIDLDDDGAVVTGTFYGTFNGEYDADGEDGGEHDPVRFTIHCVSIEYEEDSDPLPVGLFSINHGKIMNVTLYNAIINGAEYVGGIAGINGRAADGDIEARDGIIEGAHICCTEIGNDDNDAGIFVGEEITEPSLDLGDYGTYCSIMINDVLMPITTDDLPCADLCGDDDEYGYYCCGIDELGCCGGRCGIIRFFAFFCLCDVECPECWDEELGGCRYVTDGQMCECPCCMMLECGCVGKCEECWDEELGGCKYIAVGQECECPCCIVLVCGCVEECDECWDEDLGGCKYIAVGQVCECLCCVVVPECICGEDCPDDCSCGGCDGACGGTCGSSVCDDPDCTDPSCPVHSIAPSCDDPDCTDPGCPVHSIAPSCDDPDCSDPDCAVHDGGDDDDSCACGDDGCADDCDDGCSCSAGGSGGDVCDDPDCGDPDCLEHGASSGSDSGDGGDYSGDGSVDGTDTDSNNTQDDSADVDDIDAADLSGASAIIMLPLFAFGISRTNIVKKLIRRSEARAVRRINEYNARKRAGG